MKDGGGREPEAYTNEEIITAGINKTIAVVSNSRVTV